MISVLPIIILSPRWGESISTAPNFIVFFPSFFSSCKNKKTERVEGRKNERVDLP
jgi:hypothetical protein